MHLAIICKEAAVLFDDLFKRACIHAPPSQVELKSVHNTAAF